MPQAIASFSVMATGLAAFCASRMRPFHAIAIATSPEVNAIGVIVMVITTGLLAIAAGLTTIRGSVGARVEPGARGEA